MPAHLLTIGVATLPVAALLYYFWHKDRGEKEPFRLMRKVFLWGILITLPVAFIEAAIQIGAFSLWIQPPVLFWILMPFVFVALPEEFAKLVVVKKVAYNHHRFNEIMDGISYCILASLGFAIFENVLYTFQYGIETGAMRAFTAVPAHALFSGLMGYYIGLAKFTKDPQKVKHLFRKGLLAAVLFHGLYDLLLSSGLFYVALLVLPLLLYMWTLLHHAIRLANNKRAEGLDYF